MLFLVKPGCTRRPSQSALDCHPYHRCCADPRLALSVALPRKTRLGQHRPVAFSARTSCVTSLFASILFTSHSHPTLSSSTVLSSPCFVTTLSCCCPYPFYLFSSKSARRAIVLRIASTVYTTVLRLNRYKESIVNTVHAMEVGLGNV